MVENYEEVLNWNGRFVFFTDRYPFNTSEAFIENEIDIMAGNFNRVFVLPCGVMVNTATCRAVPDNVVILTPPVSDDIYKEKPSRLKKYYGPLDI